ncbi:SDR family oxidoreductase [Streptomyces sp. SID8111]|uniref:SDR family oxidoreductase n=1 Tax=Streptomyces sp. SID8111 TaxID=2706100 RepID=UPI0013C15D23|nr:SDR family oxidoreductase [Streptomyces sp. SID8111]NEC28194.1 SDR family oxidoreductase [Streptomyces sp. SID8111]
MNRTARQTVVVTGASAGIGRAAARMFAARGDRVALLARGRAGLEAAAADVRAAGGEALPLVTDMAEWEEVETAARRVEEEFGPIDVWVNNAFTAAFGRFMDVSPDEFLQATRSTYLGYVHGTRAALDRMVPRDRGTVVQVGSALAYRGIPLQSAYCGAKHAIQGFNEAVRCELLHDRSRVRVTMVQMPAVNTPQFTWLRTHLPRHAQPVPPIYRPELAARAVLRAADHPRRREYWVGTSTALTLLANAVVPGLLDHYLARTGFDSQQTDAHPQPAGHGNLFAPADEKEDYGAHGVFDDQEHGFDPQVWASRHHLGKAVALAGLAGAGYALVRRREGP